MELDEYKSIIKISRLEQEADASAVALEKFRRRRTQSVVQKIKKSLWMEAIFAVVFLLLASYFVILSESFYLQAFALLMLAFCVCFMYYLSLLYLQIREQESASSPVRTTLARLIAIVKRFIALYFQLTMIVMPLILILAFLIGYLNSGAASFRSFPWHELKVYSAASLAWMVIMYFFTRWYVKKMYGDDLKNLSNRLEELQHGQ